jgi:hypothetical protein
LKEAKLEMGKKITEDKSPLKNNKSQSGKVAVSRLASDVNKLDKDRSRFLIGTIKLQEV